MLLLNFKFWLSFLPELLFSGYSIVYHFSDNSIFLKSSFAPYIVSDSCEVFKFFLFLSSLLSLDFLKCLMTHAICFYLRELLKN